MHYISNKNQEIKMRNTKKFYFLLMLVIFYIFLLAACQTITLPGTSKNNQLDLPTLPTPASGTSIMAGKAVNQDGEPLVDVPVRLAEIFRSGEQGAFVLDMAKSPSSLTDENGMFTIININPAEYLVVVGRPEDNNYVIYQDSKNEPMTYEIAPDQIINAGLIQVEFTP
jgi:hypothetical protein